MKNIVREHALKLFEKGVRVDGRKFDEFRQPIKIEYGVSSKSAEGSAKVTIGDTEVIAGVKLDLGEPFPDTPDKGILVVNTELVPLSSPDFEMGPPGINSIELSRVVDRAIREANTIDMKKLCITKGEKVWAIFVDIYPLNEGGNLFDAAALASIAALKDTKFPTLTKDNIIDYNKRTSKGLPLQKIPVSCTVRKIKDVMILDPTYEEEKIEDARLTVGVDEEGTLCAMQKGGDAELSFEEIEKIVDLAIEGSKFLRKHL